MIEFREQLTVGTPTNDDEIALRKLVEQIKDGKVVVKLFLRHQLHAKLYLLHKNDQDNPRVGYLGSSNLTFAGFSGQGELNVDVVDPDASLKLSDWFNDRWNDRYCVDISKDLINVIGESWAREDLIPPYYIYLIMAYHLSQEARTGLSEFRIPADLRGRLMEFQEAAVKIAAHHSPYLALYHLAITTGMRLGELYGLKWIDLQWDKGILHVQRQVQQLPKKGWSFVEPKTKAGTRSIKLGEGTLQILREHRILQTEQKEIIGDRWKENGLIFPSSVGTPGDPSNMRKDFNKTLEKAGINQIRFHDLRHTAASLLFNNNIPVIVVSRLLGHSKASVTLDVYGHLYSEM